ncbi:MAG: ABC transporter permease, partial [Gammaproteobacteria bacterium]
MNTATNGNGTVRAPRRDLLQDLRRIALFAALRLLALFITVLVGVYLAILIANMGGEVDELRRVQIRTSAAEAVRADPAFQD